MTYNVLLFLTRSAKLNPEEFKEYYENTHVPLARSLLEDDWPSEFRRRYLARIYRKGFGSAANPDRPVLALRGGTADLDCDCIADLIFRDERHFQRFYAGVYQKDNAALLARDEENFLMPGMTKIVVVGETCTTDADGHTARESNHVARADSSDSEGSVSEHSQDSPSVDLETKI